MGLLTRDSLGVLPDVRAGARIGADVDAVYTLVVFVASSERSVETRDLRCGGEDASDALLGEELGR